MNAVKTRCGIYASMQYCTGRAEEQLAQVRGSSQLEVAEWNHDQTPKDHLGRYRRDLHAPDDLHDIVGYHSQRVLQIKTHTGSNEIEASTHKIPNR